MKLPSPIIIFMVVSAGIHAGLVIVSNNEMTVTLPGTTGSVMAIKIENKKQIIVENKEIRTNKPQQLQQWNKTAFTTTKIAEYKNKKITIKNISSIRKQQNSKAHVTSILIEEFHQYFSYPKLAIKHNWQGKVLLSLRITKNGMIENIKVDNSSGYNILDQAAIDSMLKVKTLPKISSFVSNNIELKIPVIYQLTEG